MGSKKILRQIRAAVKTVSVTPIKSTRKLVLLRIRKRAYRMRRFAIESRTRIIDRSLGQRSGNLAFWRGRGKFSDWTEVESRLFLLFENNQDNLEHFVQTCLRETANPMVVVNLSRSSITQKSMAIYLREKLSSTSSDFDERFASSQMIGASFAVAAGLLLGEEEASEFLNRLVLKLGYLSQDFLHFVECNGSALRPSPKHEPLKELAAGSFNKAAQNRLIISNSSVPRSELALLCSGAASATILAMDDLYGRLDILDFKKHAPNCKISVEHPRSRISRFSREYHEIHEVSKNYSQTVCGRIVGSNSAVLSEDDAPVVELALADAIFFQMLGLSAISKLLNGGDFDHIVIFASEETKQANLAPKQFSKLIATVEANCEPASTDFVLLARGKTGRAAIDAIRTIFESGPRFGDIAPLREYGSLAVEMELEHTVRANRISTTFWEHTEVERIAFIAAQSGAYDQSTGAYFDAIAEDLDARFVFVGSNLFSALDSFSKSYPSNKIIPFPKGVHARTPILCRFLENALRCDLKEDLPDILKAVIQTNCSMIASSSLASIILHLKLCESWVSDLSQRDELPNIAVLTPFRDPRVAAFASVFRRANVPSLAVEPHGLNANYCRYTKISTDYYGVISSYFSKAAEEGFGIAQDRCLVIGSPRLKAPVDYDFESRIIDARQKIDIASSIKNAKSKFIVTFFSQPSNWEHMSAVWEIVVRAVEQIDCILVLKCHPEDSKSREREYVALARSRLHEENFLVSGSSAIDLIESSNVVLSGYSATLFEAALYRTPAFGVTSPQVEYPLSQHEVIGSKLFDTATSLKNALVDVLEQPKKNICASEAFLSSEPQLVEGFGPTLVEHLKRLGDGGVIREPNDLPPELFLSAPHKEFNV